MAERGAGLQQGPARAGSAPTLFSLWEAGVKEALPLIPRCAARLCSSQVAKTRSSSNSRRAVSSAAAPMPGRHCRIRPALLLIFPFIPARQLVHSWQLVSDCALLLSW